MVQPEDRVPGVTFHMVNAAMTGTALGESKTVRVTLDALVTDDELWEEVKKKFDGLRIYKGEDFHRAVIEAVKCDLDDVRHENEQLQRDLRQEKDARMLAEAELARYREPLARFDKALRGG